MQHVSWIKSKVLGKGGKLSLLLIAVLAVGFFAANRHSESAQAVVCSGAPDHAQLNVFPITFQSPAEFCHDYSPIDARLATDSGQYSQNQADYNDGLTAHDGDQVYILSYIHNGADNVGVSDSQTLAKQVAIATNVPTSTGTDHVITTHFAGSNTNTVNGSFTIHTAPDEHLEVVAGSGQKRNFTATQILDSGFDMGSGQSYSIGDQHACFEFAVFVRFTIKVVKNPVVTTDNAICVGSVVLSPAAPAPGQPFTGTVTVRNTGTSTWDTTNFALGSQNPQGNTMWGQSSVGLPRSNIMPNEDVAVSISSTAPTAPGSYNFAWQMYRNTSAGRVFFGAICQAVIVIPPTNNQTVLKIVKEVRDLTGTTNPNFDHNTNAHNGDTLEYRIQITNIGQFTATGVVATDTMASGLVYVPNSVQVSVNYSGQLTGGGMSLGNLAKDQTITITYRATVNQSSGTITNTATADAENADLVQDQAHVTISVLPPPVCVPSNQNLVRNPAVIATFTATGGNGTFSWSAPGGDPTSGSGSSFNTSYNTDGTKTVTVTSNGLTGICTVTVTHVDNFPPVCAPDTQNVFVGQTATFTASAGNGTFSWSAPGGNPSSGSGSSFNTTYAATGSYTVTVTSGGLTDTCDVVVKPVIHIPPICDQSDQNVLVNETVFFTASGGNGTFSWSAPSGNPSSGSGSSFHTKYASDGDYTVTVTSDGLSDSCDVKVRKEFKELICSPGSQTADEDETVFFSAVGGNGNYSWSAPGGRPSSGTGSDFDTRYNSPGTKTVRVTSNGQSDDCIVKVREITNNFRELSIRKLVRNITSGSSSFQNSVSATNGDRVEYQITIRNTGNDTVSNVVWDDDLPNGITLVNSSNDGGSLGSLSDGQTRTITFQANVNSNASSGSCLVNTAGVKGSGVSRITDSASVCVSSVKGENINLQFSKRARNDTQNVSDATTTTANRGDLITYTLVVTNTGNSAATNFVISDDLSGVLAFADMVDLGGGTLSGNIISFPGVTVPANGGTVSKTFQVRIKPSLQTNLTFVLRNTYGNTVNINVGSVLGTSIFVAPTTGAAGTSAAVFAGLITAGFLAFRKRQWLKKLVFT
jgi:uncharacterized repeat protein (TIGR01451 family)